MLNKEFNVFVVLAIVTLMLDCTYNVIDTMTSVMILNVITQS